MNEAELHAKLKRNAAAVSVGSNTALVVGKLAVGYITGSVSVLSEGIHSGIDLLAAAMAYFSVVMASRPATRDHPSGLGKIESLSGFFEALLILGAAFFIVYEAAKRIFEPAPLKVLELGVVVMGVSIVVNTLVSRRLMKVSKLTDSIALEADAAHLSTDVLSSVGVMMGLFLVKMTGWLILDPIIAIAMALLICKVAYELTAKSLSDLLDVRMSDEEEKVVRDLLERHKGKLVAGEIVRSRKSGSQKFVDLNLIVCRNDSIAEAHKIADHIEERIMASLPRSTVHSHVEPCDWTDFDCPRCKMRSIEEKKVLDILKRHKEKYVDYHDFSFRQDDGQTFVEFHIALCRNESLSSAHDVCEMLEMEIAAQFKGAKITVHVDPCHMVSNKCNLNIGRNDPNCFFNRGRPPA